MNRSTTPGPPRPHDGRTGPADAPASPARRRIALFVLLVLVAGPGLATTVDVLHSTVRNGQPAPPAADSCPDPDTDGQPCGPTCLCLCCPGHAAGLAVFVPRPALGIPPSSEFEPEAHDDLRPKGVLRRIFHPPRA